MTNTQTKLFPGGIAPPAGLAVAAVGSGGTFGAATYFWKITFRTIFGETSPSNEATVAIVSNGSANLTWTAPPARVIGVRVYRGTVTNTENTLVADLPGSAAAYTDTGTGAAGTPPAAGSFATITTGSTSLVSKSSNALSGLTPGQLNQALRAINYWHNQPANPTVDGQATKILAAVGLGIQEV